MEITKPKGFNTYTVKLSYLQLQTLHSLLRASHADPVSDEMFQGFEYFMQGEGNLPLPGESGKSETPEQNQAKKDLDSELPAPPVGPPEGDAHGNPPIGGEGEDEPAAPNIPSAEGAPGG